jgi:hypothetical protein
MPPPFPSRASPPETIRQLALRHPHTAEATSCNKAAFKARDKAFCFLGADDRGYNVMLKLHDSLPQASSLAKKQPAHYKVGVHGWVTLTFPLDQAPPADLLQRWIDESFHLLAPKQLTAPPAAGTTKKRPAKRKKP